MTHNRSRTIEINLLVLGIDSNYDDEIIQLTFQYRQAHVYPYLVEQGFTLEYCQGKLARRCYVASAARDCRVVYITGSGHGFPDTFTGDWGTPLFKVGDYSSEESQGKIVHLLSCKTAGILGEDMVQHGCLAFFGYDQQFIVVIKTAHVFFECDSEIDKAFADGLTAAEVYHRVYDLYQKRIQEYRDRYIEGQLNGEDSSIVAIWKTTYSRLQFNLNHLCAPSVNQRWGDLEAKLY